MFQFLRERVFFDSNMKSSAIVFATSGLLAFASWAEDSKPPVAAPPVAPPAAAVASAASLTAKFPDEKERNSYAIGLMIAADMKKNLQRAGFEVNVDTVAKAFSEGLSGRPTVLTDVEAQGIVRAYSTELRQKQEEKLKVEGEKNKQAGEAFLAANKLKEGVLTLPSGLQYKILKAGQGARPTNTDTVVTHYRGTLIDGTEFDSSYTRGEPASFPVNRVVKGWTEALQLMPVGSKWQLFVPAELGYGVKGSPPKIGPNSTLIFDLDLLSIKDPTALVKPAQPAVTSDIIRVPSKAEMDKGAKIEVLKPADVEKLQKEEASKKSTGEAKPAKPASK